MPQNPHPHDTTPAAAGEAREPFTTPVVEELGSLDALTMETISAGGGT
jgi:hypothetical protein